MITHAGGLLIAAGLFTLSTALYPMDAFAVGDGVAIGNSRLFVSLRSEWFDATNLFPPVDERIDSTGLMLRPGVAFKTGTGDTRFKLGYDGIYARYDDAEDADYDDHNVYVSGEVTFSSRSRLSLSGNVAQKHILYGATLSRTLSTGDEPITYQNTGLTLSHTYGAKEARGNLRTELDWDSRDYDNYASLTDGLGFSSITSSVSLLYSVSSDTRALVGLSYQMLDYEAGGNSDSGTLSLFTGSEWEATGKSGGSARIGVSSRDFDVSSRDTETAMTLAATAYWTPLSYSRFNLRLNRNFAVDTTSNTVATTAAATWRHDWSSRFRSFVDIKHQDYQSDVDTDDRTLDSARLRLGVGVTQWLALTGEVAKEWSASPSELLDFEREWMAVGLEVEL